jgi:hypothetical protein
MTLLICNARSDARAKAVSRQFHPDRASRRAPDLFLAVSHRHCQDPVDRSKFAGAIYRLQPAIDQAAIDQAD